MKISIITVTRDAEITLPRLLDSTRSILDVCHDIEHIIIDGASTDKTCSIIREYATGRQNVRFISESDNGIYDAMNKGILMSSGEYVLHLNGDDWVCDINNFMAVYERLFKVRPAVLSTPVLICRSDGSVVRILKSKPYCAFHKRFGFHFPHQGTLIRNDVLKQLNNYNVNIGYVADKIFFYKVLDSFPESEFDCLNCIVSAQGVGGISSKSYMTPLMTIKMTIQSAQFEGFKNPILRAVFNFLFKVVDVFLLLILGRAR